jgi:DNA-binding MarR family transcriptional regulator
MGTETTAQFDKTLLQPTRLAAVAYLVRFGGEASFGEVRAAIGNPSHTLLWSHNRILEAAGYVEIQKLISGHQVKTLMVLTDAGRRAFAQHKAALEAA